MWEHSITTIPGRLGPSAPDDGNLADGTFFHAVGKQKSRSTGESFSHNYILHRVYENFARRAGLVRGPGTPDQGPDMIINRTAFYEHEYQEGVKARKPPVPQGGFQNSLFYRRYLFSQAMLAQIPEHQAQRLNHPTPLRVTDYNHDDCAADMRFYVAWRRQHSKDYPLNEPATTTADLKKVSEEKKKEDLQKSAANADLVGGSQDPKMCALYLEAVMNAPVNITGLNFLPPLDDLQRRLRSSD